MQKLMEAIAELNAQVRSQKPLIHHLTNYVTVNDCANIVLAIGASPIMADDIAEASDITRISSALVLNIGTLNTRTVSSMLASGKAANESGIPVVLDPVGAGASQLRNETTQMLIGQVKLAVLRGNLSEIRFISGLASNTKGVDAAEEDMQDGLQNSVQMAKELAQKLQCTVAITGAVDIVTDGVRVALIHNGHKKLSDITGTGCMCSSLVGSYCGVGSDAFTAAAAGIVSMGIAGEIAYEKAAQMGNGSYHMAILDAISLLNGEVLRKRGKIDETAG